MRVERVVHYEPHEEIQLRYLKALGETQDLIYRLRVRAVRDAVAMGITMRPIATATGWSPMQVSRLAAKDAQ